MDDNEKQAEAEFSEVNERLGSTPHDEVAAESVQEGADEKELQEEEPGEEEKRFIEPESTLEIAEPAILGGDPDTGATGEPKSTEKATTTGKKVSREYARQGDKNSRPATKKSAKAVKKVAPVAAKKAAPATKKVGKVPLVRKAAAPKEFPLCECGCKQRTRGGYYIPGHDAQHKARLKAAGKPYIPVGKRKK